ARRGGVGDADSVGASEDAAAAGDVDVRSAIRAQSSVGGQRQCEALNLGAPRLLRQNRVAVYARAAAGAVLHIDVAGRIHLPHGAGTAAAPRTHVRDFRLPHFIAPGDAAGVGDRVRAYDSDRGVLGVGSCRSERGDRLNALMNEPGERVGEPGRGGVVGLPLRGQLPCNHAARVARDRQCRGQQQQNDRAREQHESECGSSFARSVPSRHRTSPSVLRPSFFLVRLLWGPGGKENGAYAPAYITAAIITEEDRLRLYCFDLPETKKGALRPFVGIRYRDVVFPRIVRYPRNQGVSASVKSS